MQQAEWNLEIKKKHRTKPKRNLKVGSLYYLLVCSSCEHLSAVRFTWN